MKQDDRISQVRHHLPGKLCALAVIIGQQFEASLEPPAVFACLKQSDIE